MGRLTFHLFDVLVTAGIVQAVLMALLLLFRAGENRLVKWYILILLTLGALSFKILLHTLGLWEWSCFRYFPLGIDTLLPVLLYGYAMEATGRRLEKHRIIVFSAIPALFFCYSLLIYIFSLSTTSLSGKDALAERWYFDPVKSVEDVIGLVMAIVSWILSFRAIRQYRTWLDNSQSDTSLEEYKWLKNLLLVTGVLVLAFVLVVLLEDLFKSGRHDFVVLQVFYLYLAALSYYLALKGFILYGREETPKLVLVNEAVGEVIEPNEAEVLISQRIRESLETDQLHLRPELNIKELATHIGYPAAEVSAVINAAFGCNFRTLVNRYRVGAVKKLLKDPPAHLSLLGIALECGFNSEASFYRIFRQETGMSPSDYQRNLRD